MREAGTVALGILGWVLSYGMFWRWLQANDWRFFAGWAEAFTASDFGTGLLLDLVVVTGMVIFLAVRDRARLGPRWVAAIICSLALSVSVALALYLLAYWRTEAKSVPVVNLR